ncbi:MAG: tRNA (N6-threonylcarbamoyladenosine(37)-N6)-methyltransferase TrmO [Desulfobacteraceae bacterium]|nr:tRNA (N6-threonylcarbamoyladenosine(37)-N6)-methyltransferase TrmO [Desulfobacteraceae bacterium]
MKTIGIIKTPFTQIENMPIQPKGAKDIEGRVIVDEIYKDGLKDLEGFSHIYLIYHFHKADKTKLIVKPFLDTEERGVFSTRSPLRPNHIGISIVQLEKIEGNELFVKGADILDNTPLLDIKPYVEKFDHPEESRSGWMKSDIDEIASKRSDLRFK